MPPTFSYTSTSSSSFSTSYRTSSSSSSSNAGPRTVSQTHESHSTPAGTATRTTNSRTGKPTVQETRYFDGKGREVVGGRIEGAGSGYGGGFGSRGVESGGVDRRIEDVSDESDADRVYRERMEEEYAKREGGA
ncbi:hypothetical protein K490DRAFT_63510 [Saccharata proteae CBS 121410]|uniref:Uncharacterized protein n=1 Tax=Saccharata proteae CBS 121410 TaxID=1314787 RepID=A0A6A5YCY1_9PEZI|nr:hypothetical protein K490DRAFT_63510 [Saccharata proteae CBS 121410]